MWWNYIQSSLIAREKRTKNMQSKIASAAWTVLDGSFNIDMIAMACIVLGVKTKNSRSE
jgi:hypothetical protein